MSLWFIGLILIVAYLAIQNVCAHIRHKNLVATFSIIANIVGTIGQLPEEEARKCREAWAQAKENSSFNVMGATAVFILILIFLVALGFRGHF